MAQTRSFARKLAILFAAQSLSCAWPQSPQSAPTQLSPKAAYAEAMQPLTTTRAQVSNWSDAEIAALKVTIARAAAACAARQPKDFDDQQLIDLAKLCAVGQAWPAVVESTTRYINSIAPRKPLLNQAYAAQIDANLNLKNEPAALAGARAMLSAVAYDALTAQAVDEALAYMQFANTTDAIELSKLRQPLILASLNAQAKALPTPPTSTSAESSPAPQSINALYTDGLTLAALQQLAGKLPDAAATVAELDRALPVPLPGDDSIPITAARHRYALLGNPLPDLHASEYLRKPEPLPELPARNAITALLLFPDWCPQCVRMGRSFPQTVFTVAGHEAYLYGVLAETVPPHTTASQQGFDPADAALLLAGTPTLVVEPSILDRLAVNGVPFLLLADASGTVRVAQAVDPTAILPGNTIDTAIACVGAYWPVHSTPVPQANSPSGAHSAARPIR